MADRTGIEWTDATWNPVVGCSLVSPGCTNCYAMKMAARLEAMTPKPSGDGNPHLLYYRGTKTRGEFMNKPPVWTGKVAPAPDQILTQPMRWRRGRRIFVNSMGDLFHEDVPDAWIDHAFAVMALCPQHTFQVLTKRAARMRAYCTDPGTPRRIYEMACEMVLDQQIQVVLIPPGVDERLAPAGPRIYLDTWPLPNVWLGVSAEDQKRADERVPDLLATPAARRFVSCEPLLGKVDLTSLDLGDGEMDALNPTSWADEVERWRGTSETWEEDFIDWYDLSAMPTGGNMAPTLDLVIVGGESGPGARPMHPDWARSLSDQCSAADVPFFFKQWGEWLPVNQTMADGTINLLRKGERPGEFHSWGGESGWSVRVGKARAGRLLDGVEHNGMPERAAHG